MTCRRTRACIGMAWRFATTWTECRASTMPPIPQGRGFDCSFVLPDSGTHWLHPHTGLQQLDRGLYAPFIVHDPNESPGCYDREWIVVLDDWTDGVGKTPEVLTAHLKAGGGSMMGGGMGGDS